MTSRVLQFLQNEVTDYIVTDINRLASIRPQGSKGLGSCATAEAMLLFVVMDYFGYLIRSDCRTPDPGDTAGNLRELFRSPVAGLPSEYDTRAKMMTQLYRHGLMHQIFPKAAGIQKAGPDQPLFRQQDGLDHLNVDRLAQDVLKMIDRFTMMLPSQNELCDQMYCRMDVVSAKDYAKWEHLGRK